MNTKEKQVLSAFRNFWNTWATRANGSNTINDIYHLFDKDVSAIGSGEHELGKTLAEVLKNFTDDFNELTIPLRTNFFYEKVKILAPTAAMVEAEAFVYLDMEDGSELKFHLRFSTVFVHKNDKWLLTHNHVSIPASEQDIGEAYPIDALKAKNNRLQKLVSQRTEELEERSFQLQQEKEKTESLLYNILPKKIARELIQTGKNQPARHERVSVLFTDFKEFTKIAAMISAKELVEELNDIFFHFDDIIKAENLEKIKTIGDSYMVVCGVPEEDEEHAIKCVNVAKRMLQFIEARNHEREIKWGMRIGIHSGPVVAGVVGNHKFTYDLWGNTVNLASRLEGAGKAGKINISEQTYKLIKDRVECNHRGKIKIKGKEEIDMYFVA